MRCGKAEDAGGLTPAKGDNAVHAVKIRAGAYWYSF